MRFVEPLDATKMGIRVRPDFVAADRHASDGRKHIANHVRSRSQADTDATMAGAASRACMKHAAYTATPFEPISYELHNNVTV